MPDGRSRRLARSARAARPPSGFPRGAVSTILVVAVAVASAGVIAACGDDLGPEEGRMEAFVRDDPGTLMPTLMPAVGTPSPPAETPAAIAAVQGFGGTAAGDFQAAISADGQTWVELGSPNGITVPLQTGERVTVHGAQDVPAGTYSRVRLVLQDVEITVEAGSDLDGLVLEEDAKLDLAVDAPLVVERDIGSFTVPSGGRAELLFELNAELWLDRGAVEAGAVSPGAVEPHVTAAIVGS